ncbi:hypothetical protein BC829DRAFT_442420 [Chytridium lagenaria]|nr:hypothetical protein BC829DRAFT_442420 [Chytridium lagenaria]
MLKLDSVETSPNLRSSRRSAIATSAQSTCTSPQDGKICLSNCKGAGFFVTAPQLINGFSKGVKVGLSLPESLKKVDLDFSRRSRRPMVGLLNLPDFVAANGTSLGGNVQLDMDQVSFSALNDAVSKSSLEPSPSQRSHPTRAPRSRRKQRQGPERGEAAAGDDPAVCLEYVGFTAGSQLIGLTDSRGHDHGASKDRWRVPSYGEKCGTVVLPNMSLALGENNFAAKSFIFPDKSNIKALIATKDLMSRFTGNTEVMCLGRQHFTKLPANKELLIKKSTANVSSLSYSSKADSSIEMMANIGAFNPLTPLSPSPTFSQPSATKAKTASLPMSRLTTLSSRQRVKASALNSRSNSTVKSTPLSVVPNSSSSRSANGDVKVDVKSTLTLDIGGYPSVIDCSEPGSYCLGDCKEDGLKLPMPSLSLKTFYRHRRFVKLGVPEWLSYINFAFSGAGASIAIGAPGPLIAQIDTPDYETATGSIKEGTVGLNIVEKDFKALSKEGMEQLLKFITLNSGPTPVRMKGVANNKAKFPAPFDRGDVCLRYINFDIVSTSLIGLGGLRDTGIELEVPLAITNPSNIVLHANADITMDFVFDKQKLGTVVLEKFRLEKGVNNLKAKAFVHPDPTNFTGGVVSDVTVGNGKAEGLELLDAALQAVSIPQKLPANQDKLIIDAVANGLTLDYPATYPDTGLPNDLGLFATLEASLTAYNPFHVPVTIVKVTGKLFYKGIACLLIDTPVKGFTIPPRSSIVSPPILTGFDNREDPRDDSLCNEFLGKQLSGEKSLLELRNTLTIVIDKGYLSQIDYVQKDVSVSTSF